MSAEHTWDVFAPVDSHGSYAGPAWGGCWGKQGPDLHEQRAALVDTSQRTASGATTFGEETETTDVPVTSGPTGTRPILSGADDTDSGLLESLTLAGHTRRLDRHPTPR